MIRFVTFTRLRSHTWAAAVVVFSLFLDPAGRITRKIDWGRRGSGNQPGRDLKGKMEQKFQFLENLEAIEDGNPLGG